MLQFLLWSALGSLWHYLYNLTNSNYFVGLIAPVNESIWEHMKLAFFPGLLISIILKKRTKSELPTIIIATWLIPILFYSYSGILGFELPIIDILIFFISIIFSLLLKMRLKKHPLPDYIVTILCIITIFQFIAFLYFSYNPLNLGIFKIP